MAKVTLETPLTGRAAESLRVPLNWTRRGTEVALAGAALTSRASVVCAPACTVAPHTINTAATETATERFVIGYSSPKKLATNSRHSQNHGAGISVCAARYFWPSVCVSPEADATLAAGGGSAGAAAPAAAM